MRVLIWSATSHPGPRAHTPTAITKSNPDTKPETTILAQNLECRPNQATKIRSLSRLISVFQKNLRSAARRMPQHDRRSGRPRDPRKVRREASRQNASGSPPGTAQQSMQPQTDRRRGSASTWPKSRTAESSLDLPGRAWTLPETLLISSATESILSPSPATKQPQQGEEAGGSEILSRPVDSIE